LGPRNAGKRLEPMPEQLQQCGRPQYHISSGRLFQTDGAAAAKGQLPIVERWVQWPASVEVVNEQSHC